eukprot:9667725-Alexandrium_andersonii.AAC.1
MCGRTPLKTGTAGVLRHRRPPPPGASGHAARRGRRSLPGAGRQASLPTPPAGRPPGPCL